MVSAIDGWAVSDSGVIVRYTAPAPPTGIHFTAFNQAPPGLAKRGWVLFGLGAMLLLLGRLVRHLALQTPADIDIRNTNEKDPINDRILLVY